MKKSITLYTAATVIALSSLSLNLAAADCKGARNGAAFGGGAGAVAATTAYFIGGASLCGPFAPWCLIGLISTSGALLGAGAGGIIDGVTCNK